jgi:hypothetical protein
MKNLTCPINERERAQVVRIDNELRDRVPALRAPFVAPWEEQQRLVVDRGQPWLFGPLEVDPYRRRDGGYPMPAPVDATLRSIAAAGAAFHRIAIAHELASERVGVTYLEELPAGGVLVPAAEARRMLGPAPAAEESVASARRLDEALRRTGRAVRRVGEGVATVAAGTAAVVLAPLADPIVFGVVGLHGLPLPGQPALHYPLAAWLW